MVKTEFYSIIGDRIMVLDGAMGTMIQRYRPGCGNSELLNLEQPEIISRIHSEYIMAGADIIECNSFSANRISQSAHGLEDKAEAMAFEAARLAREAADKAGRRVFVAGSIGPTNKSLTLAQDADNPAFREYSFDQMAASYAGQIRALIDGGADLLIVETCFDALNCKAALYAASLVSEEYKRAGKYPERFGDEPVPVIVSVSVSDRSGRTLTGQTLEAFYTSVRHYPLLAFGINCSLGAGAMSALVEDISRFSDLPLICFPNAGMPNEMGAYDQSPRQFASEMQGLARRGLLNIAGGCCGTTPEHISELSLSLRGVSPRDCRRSFASELVVSGLESVHIDLETRNFTNIGERTNVAGSRKFAKLISAGDYETALKVAADQIENGALVIDINMDDAMLEPAREMETFVRYVQNDPSVAKAALMIDSSRWDAIVAGLKNSQGRCIVNSISLKDGEQEFLKKAAEISRLGAAMVVMAFDEQGQATTFSRKTAICSRAYGLLTGLGIAPQDIIFDCNVLSVGTGIPEHAAYAVDFIESVRWIKSHLPGAKTSGGVSNLSFAFRGNNKVRQAMHSAFLYHAVEAGLDMAIVNPGMLQVYDEIEPGLLACVEDVILDRDGGATDRLIAKAQEISAEAAAGTPAQAEQDKTHAEQADADQCLRNALVKGDMSSVAEDAIRSLEIHGKAVDVIEGPLMDGMRQVGELFGQGKMFLPQVVKSAKVMRTAVEALEPYLRNEGTQGDGPGRKPKVVLATVKGDIHDIGKNITGIVLGCNGFDVIDLGVMVEKETILDTALAAKAEIIAVSGLITPSLYQMEELCREMQSRGLDIPLFIGGATTSALHTAVRLAPLYGHVFYGADASQGAVNAKRCISDREAFEAEEHANQARLRELYARGEGSKNPGTKAVRPERNVSPEDFLRMEECRLEDIPTREIPVDELIPFFDWKMFLLTWGLKDAGSPVAMKTVSDGREALKRLSGGLSVRISAIFKQAESDGNNIVYDGGSLPMLRQEEDKFLSLCDFLPPAGSGFRSPFGMFAISVSQVSAHPEGCTCPSCSPADYESLMDRSVRVCLAEAASSWLDGWLRERLLRSDLKVCKPAAGYASCPDHTLKRDILSMLPHGEELGISFTESYAMVPDASICGFIFIHKDASYPEIRHISDSQYGRYLKERGFSALEGRRFLGNLLQNR